MVRTATALAAVALVAASLTACGSKGGNQAAQSTGDIEFGMYAPLSGKLASPGEILSNGVKLAIDQVNAAGGVNGRKLKLNLLDDTGNPATAVTVANQLASNEKNVAVIGSYGSTIGVPSSAALEKAQIPNIQAEVSAPDAVKRGFKYMFNTYPLGTDVESATFVKGIEEKKIAPKRVALLYIDSPSAGSSAQYLTDQAASHGYQIVSDQKIQLAQASYASVITKIKSSNPDTVWMGVNGAEAKTLFTNMQQLGLKPKTVFGEGNPLIDPTVTEPLGNLTQGVMVGVQWWPSSPDEANQSFLTDYKAKYGVIPPQMGPGGFQAVQLLVAALKTLPADKLTRDNLRDALAGLKDTPTVYGPVEFADNGQVQYKVLYLLQTQGDKQVVILPDDKASSGTSVVDYLGTATS